ncbi:hypothetical protein PHYPSEUDO_006846 [Phytophthora pseudosyringae]|uniref:Uncharacterized protein n=1 Tax=Phytophthora pseudosyringae TaxID=221518 RepID=A0A8T1WAT2_9STRA|nr:hypothetical protein PHYPSEUDO_006846 [Phytophthora pseudosyringae]
MTTPPAHEDAAFAVLTDYGLLQHITSFQDGLPYLVGQIDASLDCSTQLGSFRGKLPRFAIRQRDLHVLEVLRRATQNPRLQNLPQLEFWGVRRCAIQYNSLELLKWLHSTRDKSPTMSDETRLLGVAVTCYFDNVEILEWLNSAPEGPREPIAVTEVELCRAAGFGNPPPRGSGVWGFRVARQCAIDAGHKDVARFLAQQRENPKFAGTKDKRRRCFGLL